MSDFSPVRLQRMRTAMQRHVEADYTSGLVTLAHHRGREHVDAIGTMAFDSSMPMARERSSGSRRPSR